MAYIKAVPFQFYSILAVAMVPVVVMGKVDFGPMRKAEEDCAKGIVMESSHTLEAEVVNDSSLKEPNRSWFGYRLGVCWSLCFLFWCLRVSHGYG